MLEAAIIVELTVRGKRPLFSEHISWTPGVTPSHIAPSPSDDTVTGQGRARESDKGSISLRRIISSCVTSGHLYLPDFQFPH